MKRAHLLVGLVGFLVFLGTGIYMRSGFPELYIALGIYLAPTATGWRALLSRIGSVPAILSPVVLCYAFFMEVPKASPERVLTALGVLFVALGIAGQLPSLRVREVRV